MRFERTDLDDVWLVTLEPREDERGSFARTYCAEEFAAHGLNTQWPQCNLTRTKYPGTIRGLHYQAAPRHEIKLVRCAAGAIFDVVVDVRRASPTFGKWRAFELRSEKNETLYIGSGYAHGFQALENDCEIFYMMGDSYVPDLARGFRWDDRAVGIAWPLPVTSVSTRDATLPLLAEISA